MRLAQLYYFAEVCKSLSITKSANTLHISQPSLSIAIKELEEELGLQLFHRVKQRLQLTAEGRFFYQELTPILTSLENLTQTVKSFGENTHSIKIGIPPMIGGILFTRLFTELRKNYPEIQLEVTERGTFDMEALILEEEIELAMILKESFTSEEIEFLPMIKVEIHACFHKDHALAMRDVILVEELKDEPLIMFNDHFYIHKMIRKSFADLHIFPHIILETTHLNTIKQFVQQNLASSFVFPECILENDGIVTVPVKGMQTVTMGLAWKKGVPLPKDTNKVVEVAEKLRMYP
ncbi:MAG: LysR family transcriptional regulator [Bacillota bacterium]